MRIDRVRSRLVTWPIASSGAARGRGERSALLVEVRTDSGAIGLGEAAPLPGLSPDTLEDAVEGIAALAARVPFTIELTVAAIARLAAELAVSPSARFAIETALLDAASARTGRSLAQLLSKSPATEVPSAIVVDTALAARTAVAAGARCLKIKVGRPEGHARARPLADASTFERDPDGDLARVLAIAHAAPGIDLRLDANRSWPRERARDFLFALADLQIEFVEEPCVDAHELLSAPLPCPIALDESLATLPHAALYAALRSPGLGALILKPSVVGGFSACLALAARARDAHVPVVITHALEGPIGTAACAELAIAIGGKTAAGLAPHGALAGWPITVPQLRGASVVAGRRDPDDAARLARVITWVEGVDRGAPLTLTGASGDERPTPSRPAVAPTGGPTLAIVTRGSRIDYAGPGDPPLDRVIVATPSIDTVRSIQAALAARCPIALLHPKLPAAELARQRALVEQATLPDDTAVVVFTSGSTGPSRGVVLSRGALDAAATASAAHLGWRDDDRWLLALPLAHAGGLSIVVRCLAANRPIALHEGEFERAEVAQLLDQCTLASLVPTQLAALLDDPSWRPSPHVRAVLLGGAAATPALLDEAARRGVPFLTSYGLTETFGQVATAPPDRAGDPHAPLVPLPGVELYAGTREVPARVRIRGPMLATQYLDGAAIAPEVATADLGFVEGGALHVVGRADDVIITGGENVHPVTVEAVLAATPGVRAACAFGVADERWGQIVGVAIAADASFDRVRATAAWHARLPAHARPRRIAIVDALPLLPNGKIDRRAAAALAGTPVAYD